MNIFCIASSAVSELDYIKKIAAAPASAREEASLELKKRELQIMKTLEREIFQDIKQRHDAERDAQKAQVKHALEKQFAKEAKKRREFERDYLKNPTPASNRWQRLKTAIAQRTRSSLDAIGGAFRSAWGRITSNRGAERTDRATTSRIRRIRQKEVQFRNRFFADRRRREERNKRWARVLEELKKQSSDASSRRTSGKNDPHVDESTSDASGGIVTLGTTQARVEYVKSASFPPVPSDCSPTLTASGISSHRMPDVPSDSSSFEPEYLTAQSSSASSSARPSLSSHAERLTMTEPRSMGFNRDRFASIRRKVNNVDNMSALAQKKLPDGKRKLTLKEEKDKVRVRKEQEKYAEERRKQDELRRKQQQEAEERRLTEQRRREEAEQRRQEEAQKRRQEEQERARRENERRLQEEKARKDREMLERKRQEDENRKREEIEKLRRQLEYERDCEFI